MAEGTAQVLAGLLPPGTTPQVLAVMWATVDIERTAAVSGLPVVQLPDDSLLGATVRLISPAGADPIALIEPNTEGRLAETLARSGEGPAGHYVLAPDGIDGLQAQAARAGIGISRPQDGPFGRSVLVAGSRAGPHLVLVERPAGTIDR
jgi:hypothetical protein